MSIGHSPRPRDVPIAVVGSPAAAEHLTADSGGAFDGRAVPDLAAADRLIRTRDVYAAVVPGPHGVAELHIASSASNQAANFMRQTLGRPTPQHAPKVVDASPLPKDDSNGGSIGLLLQVLIIGGSIGAVATGRLLATTGGKPARHAVSLAFLIGYALVSGVLLTGVADLFGVGTGAGLVERVLVLSLISLAVTASAGALVALIGPPGAAVAAIIYFVIGAQISGAGTAPEFLPGAWSGLGQALPAGAGTSLLRDVFYFPDASPAGPVAILAAYAVAGMLVVISRAGRARAAS